MSTVCGRFEAVEWVCTYVTTYPFYSLKTYSTKCYEGSTIIIMSGAPHESYVQKHWPNKWSLLCFESLPCLPLHHVLNTPHLNAVSCTYGCMRYCYAMISSIWPLVFTASCPTTCIIIMSGAPHESYVQKHWPNKWSLLCFESLPCLSRVKDTSPKCGFMYIWMYAILLCYDFLNLAISLHRLLSNDMHGSFLGISCNQNMQTAVSCSQTTCCLSSDIEHSNLNCIIQVVVIGIRALPSLLALLCKLLIQFVISLFVKHSLKNPQTEQT